MENIENKNHTQGQTMQEFETKRRAETFFHALLGLHA